MQAASLQRGQLPRREGPGEHTPLCTGRDLATHRAKPRQAEVAFVCGEEAWPTRDMDPFTVAAPEELTLRLLRSVRGSAAALHVPRGFEVLRCRI